MSYGYSPQDPYGGYGPGNNDPYNQYNQQYNNPYGGYGPPPPSGGNGPALAALIANILLAVTCCGLFAVPGIITAAIAMNRWHTDNVSARNLVTWSWVIFGIAIAIFIVCIVLLFGFGYWAELQADNYSTTDDDYSRA